MVSSSLIQIGFLVKSEWLVNIDQRSRYKEQHDALVPIIGQHESVGYCSMPCHASHVSGFIAKGISPCQSLLIFFGRYTGMDPFVLMYAEQKVCTPHYVLVRGWHGVYVWYRLQCLCSGHGSMFEIVSSKPRPVGISQVLDCFLSTPLFIVKLRQHFNCYHFYHFMLCKHSL